MRILALFPRRLYETKMSIGRTMYLQHLGRQDGVTVKWWGEGWEGWREDRGTYWNIDRHFGFKFDVIVSYKHEFENPSPSHVKVVCIFNECHNENAFDLEVINANPDLLLFNHQGDYESGRIMKTVDCGLMFHCAPVVDVQSEKDIDLIVTGVRSKEYYPLRESLIEFANSGLCPDKVKLHAKHPGYRLKNRQQVVDQYIQYLKLLSRSRISLCCTSVYKYPLAKLIESAMCGCVVATDKPYCDRFERLLWPHCIQLQSGMTSEGIADVISGYSDSDLKDMADASLKIARENYSLDNWRACFLEHVTD